MNSIDKYRWKRYNRIAQRAGLPKVRMDEWNENDHERDENGRFASKGGGASGSAEEKKFTTNKNSNTGKPSVPKEYKPTETKAYIAKLSEAKESRNPSDAWRVTSYADAETFDDWHPNAKRWVTEGGSTIAVSEDGDIVGVCKHKNDRSVRGGDLLKMAVEQGGTKLDAFEGLYEFYTSNGFEPVSWCKWDGDYAPDGWKEDRDKPEDVIFFKYTGNQSKYKNVYDFKKVVEASSDYDKAKEMREKDLEGSKT